MGVLRSALELASPIRPMIRIEMEDVEGPPVGFRRTWLVESVLARTKRFGRRLADWFEFTAVTPLYHHELGLYGFDDWSGDALLRRRVETEWTMRRPGRSFVWSDQYGKIGLPADVREFNGDSPDKEIELFMILVKGCGINSSG